MCAPSNSPVMTRSRTTFQFACGSSVTYSPSSSKKPFSYAIASGAMSVSLMNPSLSSSFSSSSSALCALSAMPQHASTLKDTTLIRSLHIDEISFCFPRAKKKRCPPESTHGRRLRSAALPASPLLGLLSSGARCRSNHVVQQACHGAQTAEIAHFSGDLASIGARRAVATDHPQGTRNAATHEDRAIRFSIAMRASREYHV